ncbi:MAG TPA: hypothetical protein VFY65_18025 [Longimicrobium sp.]|nr:hypothetical protein [Longimicrobium sp.]
MDVSDESPDPLLEELEEARQRIFARCDHDPAKVLQYYLEYQKQYADRLISRHERLPKGKSAA